MADLISIEGLVVDAWIGVYGFERNHRQRLSIDLHLTTDLSKAGKSDALEDTLDYDRAAAIAREVTSSKHHHLVEALAEEIAGGLLDAFAGKLLEVRVRVAKPGAVPDAKSVAVEIRRSPTR